MIQNYRERSRDSFSIVVQPGEIVIRGSTGRQGIADPYVRMIVDHLRTNYMRETALEDILSRIPLSRRSIEMRFRKEMAPMTMHRFLLSCRTDALAHLLATTDLPLPVAAEQPGFSDGGNVSRTFRRFKGCSPKEYRERHAGPSRRSG